MQGDGHAGAVEDAGEGGDVVLVGMHAAGRQQAHQMAGAAGSLQLGDEVLQARVARQLAGLHGGVDARQVLHDHAAGADVHMADLGIAHLAGRQPDMQFRGVDQRMRAIAHEAVPGRRVRQPDRVVIVAGAFPPAVEDAEHDGAGPIATSHGRYIEGSAGCGRAVCYRRMECL